MLIAADYGVAQRRPRTIVIGSRVGAIALPAPTHARSGRTWLHPGRRDRTHASAAAVTTELPASHGRASSAEPYPACSRGWTSTSAATAGASLTRYDCVPPGGGRFDLPDDLLPDCWRNKPTGTTDVMGRMRWDAPSLTIRTEFFKPEKGQYLHPQWEPDARRRVNRPITHLEAARLQEFPEDFLWCG